MSSPNDFAYVLKCGSCGKEEFLGLTQAVKRLSELGMLRRETEPDADLILELLSGTVARMACRACAATGLLLGPAETWEDKLPSVRACDVCGDKIPAERLEIFPDAKLCIACQRDEESGQVPEEPAYCPKCGNLMQVREVRRGISRYQLVCPVCR